MEQSEINNYKNTLIIAPNAGFGNRIRTMSSAIYLADKLNMNLQHLWIGTKNNCMFSHEQNIHDKSFEYFFKPMIKRCDYITMKNKLNKVYTEWSPGSYWHQFQSYGQKLLDTTITHDLSLVNEAMDTSENFLIETTYIKNLTITINDKVHIYKTYFIPHDRFLNELSIIPENTIGISFRIKDFYCYFPDSKIQNEILIKWLSNINYPVILFSDDTNYQLEMRKYLQIPIIPNFENNSASDNDFLTFLQLSKCSTLYGTAMSSFCEEAAYFGGVEYIPLTKDFFRIFITKLCI